MSMSALIVAAMLLPAASGQETPSRQEIQASARKVKELQQERIATLKNVVELSFKLAMTGHLETRGLSEARMTLLRAELEVAARDSDRIALYKEALESLKQYEEVAKVRKASARGTELDVQAIKATRLEVEIQCEQAKIKRAR